MPFDARVDAWARLAFLQLPSPAVAALLRVFGSAERIFSASRAQLSAATSATTATRIQTSVGGAVLDGTREWLSRDDHQLIASLPRMWDSIAPFLGPTE